MGVLRHPPSSKFDTTTTVAELLEWWLDDVARHQVKVSTLDSYRHFASYLIGGSVLSPPPHHDSSWLSVLLAERVAQRVRPEQLHRESDSPGSRR